MTYRDPTVAERQARQFAIEGCRCDPWHYEAHSDPSCPFTVYLPCVTETSAPMPAPVPRWFVFELGVILGWLAGIAVTAWVFT